MKPNLAIEMLYGKRNKQKLYLISVVIEERYQIKTSYNKNKKKTYRPLWLTWNILERLVFLKIFILKINQGKSQSNIC